MESKKKRKTQEEIEIEDAEIQVYNYKHRNELWSELMSVHKFEYFINEAKSNSKVYLQDKMFIEDAVRKGINKAIYDFDKGKISEINEPLVLKYCVNSLRAFQTQEKRKKPKHQEYVFSKKNIDNNIFKEEDTSDVVKLSDFLNLIEPLNGDNKCKVVVLSRKVIGLPHKEIADVLKYANAKTAKSTYKNCLYKIAKANTTVK